MDYEVTVCQLFVKILNLFYTCVFFPLFHVPVEACGIFFAIKFVYVLLFTII